MAGYNAGMGFVRGLGAGAALGEKFNEGRAGRAMADLQGFDPMAAQQAASAEEGGFGQQTNGEAKPPSTRDWVTLRQKALETAGNLGPDAVAQAMDDIDEIQKKGSLDNLYIAKELVEQGRDAEAGQYLEAANGYMGNFTAVHTSPAKMQDGSTKLAFEAVDEQTGQPKMPGMMATPEVIDRLIMMAENPEKYGEARRDREMAERDWESKQGRYDRQDYVSNRGYNLDVAEAQRRARPRPTVYESKDYDDALDAQFARLPMNLDTGEPQISPAQQQQITTMWSQARADPTLQHAPPDVLAARIFSTVMGAQPNG